MPMIGRWRSCKPRYCPNTTCAFEDETKTPIRHRSCLEFFIKRFVGNSKRTFPDDINHGAGIPQSDGSDE